MTKSFIWQQLQRWWALALIIFGLDWLVKKWVTISLLHAESVDVLPFFKISHVHNLGGGWSLLADASGWQRWFFIVVAIVAVIGISWRLVKIASSNYWESISLTLIMGGAIGNLYDRFVYGYVIDMLYFYWPGFAGFPVFNVADVAITLGVIVMLLEGYLNKKFTNKSK